MARESQLLTVLATGVVLLNHCQVLSVALSGGSVASRAELYNGEDAFDADPDAPRLVVAASADGFSQWRATNKDGAQFDQGVYLVLTGADAVVNVEWDRRF